MPKSHRHVENLDYTRTLGDYHSAFDWRQKELPLGKYQRNEDAPKWLRKDVTVEVNQQGFYTANGSIVRRSILDRYYTFVDEGVSEPVGSL